jgi:peptidoglycan hydrolase CwlO-like protein
MLASQKKDKKMVDQLLILKEEKPFIYKMIMALLVIPIILIAIVALVNPAIRSWLVSSARKLMDKTQKKDEELKASIDDAQKEIDKIDQKLETINQQLEQIKNEDDADWHKKVKR